MTDGEPKPNSPEDVGFLPKGGNGLPPPPLGKCRSCGAAVYWSVTATGAPMPVDPEPRADGNIQLTWNGERIRAVYLTGDVTRFPGALRTRRPLRLHRCPAPMPRTRSRTYRRKDSPFWWAVYTSPDGRTVRQSTGCRDRSAADAWLAVRELERVKADAGIPVARPITLLRATADYLAEREPQWSSKWWGTVEGFTRLQVVPHFGAGRTVSTITREEVARFRTAQVGRPSARGKGGKPVSPSTVNRLMWAMASWGSWCKERGYHTENPWGGHDNLPEDQVPPPSVADEKLEELLRALDDPEGPLPSHGRRPNRFPWRALFALAAETGLRKGELGRLAWEDVDLRERRAWVISSNARGHNKAKRLRSVALSQAAVAVLQGLPKRKDGLVVGPVPDPRRAFARAAKATGLGRVWLHLMRHTAATRVGRAGASLADLMGFGGWASVKMAQRYTHTDHRRQLELVDRAGGGTAGAHGAPEKATGGSESPEPPVVPA